MDQKTVNLNRKIYLKNEGVSDIRKDKSQILSLNTGVVEDLILIACYGIIQRLDFPVPPFKLQIIYRLYVQYILNNLLELGYMVY